ncbi:MULTISPECIES: hypothetical protein [unclassified Serratia (in: enterobacteria)]|uniref:hypothetical protein n=1 Tax=unclassified Serratia (in: enterobacteria) TaxID=2647522 RepID=UPI0004FFD9B8|nr:MULTISPECIES: hypothetical protein [unclassified Serratia (in: enterobacteria)]KFK94282.1 hypothetical protein JV45_13335 [Serratia sp. Ag2]KFK98324.1 hypothetical protein IV04_13060 [Serratia sp. Ag1]
MSQEITLEQAVEKAHQAEIVCRMMESYPHRLVDSEITAIAALLVCITGDVAAWLIKEQAKRDGKS